MVLLITTLLINNILVLLGLLWGQEEETMCKGTWLSEVAAGLELSGLRSSLGLCSL